ncbi:hypothetical protein A2671_02155 [Candidatus Kaiserbacteria bacterium RIFCSPHIGHO2_01_FULL_49_13]|uniref:DUF5667 domain-containing protein n=1 Tax=Candidatus Kaiserbacteria bacterium RIFCSPHIGHO2_01_FULL_49_13 TaxID=1798477 RepID=A0A1F6CCZ7_9BACT|nr:MAG: hypothetical protein A2671_02155 [Candidatus Kaiserbacteria bacterium RIFCSPHIGHO2_01_FULL_49_13]
MSNIVRHYLFFLVLLFFAFPPLAGGFASAQADPKLQVPETLDDAKEGVLNVSDKIMAAIPGVISGIWEREVVPVWKSMWNWVQEEVWQRRVQPALETLIDKVMEFFGKEVEKRKPLIEQEFEQEKQELKQDIENYGKDAGKGLWARFLGLFSEE